MRSLISNTVLALGLILLISCKKNPNENEVSIIDSKLDKDKVIKATKTHSELNFITSDDREL